MHVDIDLDSPEALEAFAAFAKKMAQVRRIEEGRARDNMAEMISRMKGGEHPADVLNLVRDDD